MLFNLYLLSIRPYHWWIEMHRWSYVCVSLCVWPHVFIHMIFFMIFPLRKKPVFQEASWYILFGHMLWLDTLHLLKSSLLFVCAVSRLTIIKNVCLTLLAASQEGCPYQVASLNLALMSLERYVTICPSQTCHQLQQNVSGYLCNQGSLSGEWDTASSRGHYGEHRQHDPCLKHTYENTTCWPVTAYDVTTGATTV